MRCSCPKCKTDITEEFHVIPAEGIYLSCPQCKANFNLKRESFARRALYKGGDISCAECGNEPGASVYCQSCHAIYPDILVAESSSAGKKQLGKILSIFKNLRKKSVKPTHTISISPSPKKQVAFKGIKLPGQPLQLAATIIILVAFLCTAGAYYYLNKIESDYMGNYIKALYVINVSENYNISHCEKFSADWKTKLTAGAPTLGANELTYLSRGLKDAEIVMQKLGKPPKKYLASNEALLQLYEIYKKHQALAVAPTGYPDSFAASSRKLGEDFRKSATTLKSGLPEKLSDKLTVAKTKFKQLQSF